MSNHDFDKDAAFSKADDWGKNATQADVDNVANNMDKMNKGPLALIWDKVVALWDAFKSPATPTSIKAMIIGGLIYMVMPIDLIADFIPVAGLVDDASVIGFTFSRVSKLIALGAVVGGFIAVVRVAVLNKKRIQQELQEREYAAAIVKNIQEDNVSRVSVGLYDENAEEVGELAFDADKVKVKEGQIIYA